MYNCLGALKKIFKKVRESLGKKFMVQNRTEYREYDIKKADSVSSGNKELNSNHKKTTVVQPEADTKVPQRSTNKKHRYKVRSFFIPH